MTKFFAKIGVAATGLTGSALALADTEAAVAAITEGSTAVAAIGGACLLVLGGAVVFKLIRRAM